MHPQLAVYCIDITHMIEIPQSDDKRDRLGRVDKGGGFGRDLDVVGEKYRVACRLG